MQIYIEFWLQEVLGAIALKQWYTKQDMADNWLMGIDRD